MVPASLGVVPPFVDGFVFFGFLLELFVMFTTEVSAFFAGADF
jgi:hypothetical protein